MSAKNNFVWGPAHTIAFESAKQLLVDLPTLKFFDPTKLTRLLTDASNKGLGFILQQQWGDKWHVLQADSRFLSDPESQYATIEKEMLGVAWAVICNQVLFNLHESHQGVTHTIEQACHAVYWLGIDQDIETIITAYNECQDELPSLAKKLMILHALPDRSFQQLALDFAQFNGRDYLIMIDCYTDWPSIQVMRQNTTTRSLISVLQEYFSCTAVPDVIWSDGGPQFTSHEFATFSLEWRVKHNLLSPGYPQSNGKAEAAIKSMKKLIRKSTKHSVLDENKLAHALLQYCNTPSRKDKFSPAQKLYGHPIQDKIPAHHRAFAPEWQNKMKIDFKDKYLEQTATYYNGGAAPLLDIQVGNHVAIQNRETGNFDIYGTVVNIDAKFRRYTIKTQSGRVFVRNRRFIHKHVPTSLVINDSENVGDLITFRHAAGVMRPKRNVN